MRLSGKLYNGEKYWPIEVPMLGVFTQGKSKRDAYFMIADAIEELIHHPGFKITVFPGKGDYFEIAASDESMLVAFMLRRERLRSGLTLRQVAERLGAKSVNAYARYEQGRAMPTLPKLSELLAAVSDGEDFVVQQSSVKVKQPKPRPVKSKKPSRTAATIPAR